jgi:hypothetical protein
VTKTRKLTLLQLGVLRDAKAGHVYRSERGNDLYSCYDRAQANKKVTAIVERLYALGLLSIGEQAGMQRPWHVTKQGDQMLAQAQEKEAL